MANSKAKGKKYIIMGIKERPNFKEIVGINPNCVKDQATYQQFIRENIEPDINLEMKKIQKDNKYLCCFIIEGNNKPYIIKKQFHDIKQGVSLIRINTTRAQDIRYEPTVAERRTNLEMTESEDIISCPSVP